MCYADLEHNRPVMTIFAGELSSLGADVLAITGIWKDDLDSLQRNLIGYIGKFKPRRRQQLHDGVLVNTNRLTVIEDEAFFVDTELNKATGCSKITCPEVAVIVVATMNGSSESVKMAIISPSTVSTLRDLQVSALVNKVERMKKADSLPIVICGVATANLEKLKSENKQKLSWQSVEGTKSGTGDTGVLYTKNNKLELKSFMPAVPSSAFQDDFLPLPYQFTLSDFNLLKDQGTLKRSLEQDESADATKTKKKVHGF